jgi:hypothetical protein
MVPTDNDSTGAVKPSGSTMVVTAKQVAGVTRVFAYDGDTSPAQIITDLVESTGWGDVKLHSVEINQEITEIQKGWFGEGIKIGASFKLTEGLLSCEIKPEKEVKTTIKVEWRKPE